MSDVPRRFAVHTRPAADPDAIVRAGNARFTVLFDRIIRLEHDRAGRFEDRPSLAFWFREKSVPAFDTSTSDGVTVIETAFLKLRYRDTPAGFTAETLSIELKQTGAVWRFGDTDPLNLGGAVRTIDSKDGPVPLAPGLLSRAGWAVADDSGMPALDEHSWARARDDGSLDLYFFGYGAAYQQCLADYLSLSGAIPLIPRWVLGNWWSRYWQYTQDELWELMQRFKAERIPLSVCVIDMDWHQIQNDSGRRGWTGYSWNRELFPTVETFLKNMHESLGLRITLNLHPHDGVWPHEDAYEDMARHMGVDPSSKDGIPFDITDPRYVRGYFELLHHPHEDIGVDFWWMDWQQGTTSSIPNLDPLWWLNHLHYIDSGRDGVRRPLAFSRWAGFGNQRYPVGFSGDAVVSWESFRFQPYLTATSANVACTWWSHDIGGHFFGSEDKELYLRWVQFGVFSPIMRLHCAKGMILDRQPWTKGAEILEITLDYMQLRHALIPYLYSEAWRCSTEGHALCRPMYHEWPEPEEAYWCPGQYRFGSGLIAAPFTEPADRHTNLSRQAVWLPEGEWRHFFTGEYFPGGRWHAVYGDLQATPVFAKAGAIIPLAPKPSWGGLGNPEHLDLHLFAGADGDYTLYEDDGETTAYLTGKQAFTTISQQWSADACRVTISAVSGDGSVSPSQRSWTVTIIGASEPEQMRATANGAELPGVGSRYDAERERLSIDIPAASTRQAITIDISRAAGLESRRDRAFDTATARILGFRATAGVKRRLLGLIREGADVAEICAAVSFAAPDSIIRCMAETLFAAGVHALDCIEGAPALVVWNYETGREVTMRFLRREHAISEQPIQGFGFFAQFQRVTAKAMGWLPRRSPWVLGLYVDRTLIGRIAGEGERMKRYEEIEMI